MATQPTQPTRPSAPPPQPPKPPADPQAAKLEAHAAPPRWEEPKKAPPPPPAFTPKPALDPRAEKPPAGAYADGMPIAEEQRARSAWIEEHGDKAYHEAVDQRPEGEQTNRQVPGVDAANQAGVTAMSVHYADFQGQIALDRLDPLRKPHPRRRAASRLDRARQRSRPSTTRPSRRRRPRSRLDPTRRA